MISMNRQAVQNCLNPLQMLGPDFEFTGVQIDSRQDCTGALFVAICGDRFDGHDFVVAAQEKGAAALVVEKILDSELPQIVVADGRQALADLARCWRRQLATKVIAITGSNGKTTVKEMLGKILSAHAPVLMTKGNLNNDIGVPLTLFGLNAEHRFAVVEMGANHMGEIGQLVSIAEPDVVYVNNARPAHVEGFGSLQNVIEAKGEMYAHCLPSATAVFNEDEPAFASWRERAATARHLGFSMRGNSEINGAFDVNPEGLNVSINALQEQASASLQVHGKHNAQNALAAMSLGLACGLTVEKVADALSGFGGVKGRQEFKHGPAGSCIIDDSYNANPDSLAAAIDVLCALPGDAWLALGDMAELGDDTQALHNQALEYAKQKGVNRCFALGEKSTKALQVFGESGQAFTDHQSMAEFIVPQLTQNINLLVKGSRSAGMDKLVDRLLQSDSLTRQRGDHHAV